MRRVLFIAYDFPPGIGIGGGLRSVNFAHYLPEFAWQATVVALDGGQEKVSGVVRLASPTPWHSPYEVTPYGWAYALHRYLCNCSDGFDLVYVSCPPFPQALAAATYARRKQLPLVVDFRDAWSLDPYQEGSRFKRILYRHLFPSVEKHLLLKTDSLILNTPSTLQAYQALYPRQADKMVCLPNGYDERAFPDEMPQPSRNEFVLLHAGRFGIGARSPDNLLTGMKLARQAGCDARLVILGNQPEVIQTQILAAGLGDGVELRGQIEYSKAVTEMCFASVLVLVQAPSQATVQAVAGKTFDYLRAGRPILAIGPAGDNMDLVHRYAGSYRNPADEPAAIAEAIISLHQEWDRGGYVKHKVDPVMSERYERRALTARLVAHFDQLLSVRTPCQAPDSATD